MGNFTSSSCSTPSRPTTIPSPSPPPPTPSHRKDQTTLTSTLTAHATRLAHPFRLSSTRLDDIEEGLSLTVNDTDARGPHADAEVFNGRRRALLIGIAYNGELSNTHKDVDRYRDMLLGTLSLFCFYRFLFSPLALLSLTFFIVSLLLFFLFLLHRLTLAQARTATARRMSWCSRTTLLCLATSSRPVRTSSVHPSLFLRRSPDLFVALVFGTCSCASCRIWWPTPRLVIASLSSVRASLVRPTFCASYYASGPAHKTQDTPTSSVRRASMSKISKTNVSTLSFPRGSLCSRTPLQTSSRLMTKLSLITCACVFL